MQAAGLRGCAYAICDQHIATPGGLYMSRGELHALQDAGWDIGCHADAVANHNAAAGFTALDPVAFDAACRAMKAWQVVHGFRSDHFAWPRGKHTAAHRAIAARYFSRSAPSAATSTASRPTSIHSPTRAGCVSARSPAGRRRRQWPPSPR